MRSAQQISLGVTTEPPLGRRTQCVNHITACPKQHGVGACGRMRTEGGPPPGLPSSGLPPNHQALPPDGTARHTVLGSLPPSLVGAVREMLSSGTQKGRNVAGALLPGDLSKTKQVNGAERQEARGGERKTRAKERELLGP